MSLSAMKQALMQLNRDDIYLGHRSKTRADAISVLRQAIAEAEKQEAVAWMWKDGTLTSDPDFADGTWTPLFTAPVYFSDISQEPVDETAKREHKFEEMVKKGTKAWDGTPDDWVDELRGGPEEPQVKTYAGGKPNYTTPPDDIYDIRVEKELNGKNVS